jgi:succinate-semialdehyde dehydrogenase/glutarate-semialdehyde dehydrogenase
MMLLKVRSKYPENEGVMYGELGLFIDGAWRKHGGGNRGEDVINPATEKPLATLPHASKADLDAALDAAKKGFAVWKATSAYDRAKIMRKAADLMRERHDAIELVNSLALRRNLDVGRSAPDFARISERDLFVLNGIIATE